MVNEQIVNDTVKRMIDSGIDTSTIIATLKDIGLSEEEANKVIQKISAPPTPPTQPAATPETEDARNEVREMKEQMVADGEKHEAHAESTNAKLEEHDEKLAQVEQKANEAHEAVQKAPVVSAPAANQKTVTELNSKLDEVSATSKATRDLMKQVLEINRKILTELESKR